MISCISILGSTGSVGRQTADAAERLGLRVCAITANSATALLEAQARRLRPSLVAVMDEAAAGTLKTALADTNIRVVSGMEGLCEAAELPQAQAVVTAVSGAVGLRPTLRAIAAGKRICLANKETLVCAGELVMAEAASRGVDIIPVDSEHSAIFQCLSGRDRRELRRILLTGSGGPFRGMTREQTAAVTPERAVRHPNWHMGAKISVDSATLMNKGLEFIEAMRLFSVSPEQIKVLIHPESVIHSMVELLDGTVIAQLGVPDMALPIQYALSWPERRQSATPPPDFTRLGSLSFSEPDTVNFPCLALAMDAARQGGTAPAVLNAANETAVHAFLNGRIGFNDIAERVSAVMSAMPLVRSPSLSDILAADSEARERASVI